MAKGKKSGHALDLSVDFSGIIEALAAGRALTNSVSNTRTNRVYLDAVVDVAYGVADDQFNVAAEAYAKTGAIKHMYEWGTLGINPARTNMRPNPNSPSARLWETMVLGHGLDRNLSVIYKPSKAYVPKPTTRDTGMSQEIINRMRNYRFTWKAKVLENGEFVHIAPKRRFILVPAYPENRVYMKPSDIKRGYQLLTRDYLVQPGRQVKGNFTEFWMTYWQNQGSDIVNRSVQEQYLGDFEPIFRAANYARRGPKPLYTTSIRGKIDKRAKQLEKIITAKARQRAVVQKA